LPPVAGIDFACGLSDKTEVHLLKKPC
jgi:hypothetical protein